MIDLNSGKWDLLDITDEVHKEDLLRIFNQNKGKKYDWFGALGFGIPFFKQNPNKEYCFELNAKMLGLENPHKYTPSKFIKLFSNKKVQKL